MEPYVFALPIQICTTNTPPVQVDIGIDVIGVDAKGDTISTGITYCYDNTQSAASNMANIKAAIVKQVESIYNITLLTNNITLLMAVN